MLRVFSSHWCRSWSALVWCAFLPTLIEIMICPDWSRSWSVQTDLGHDLDHDSVRGVTFFFPPQWSRSWSSPGVMCFLPLSDPDHDLSRVWCVFVFPHDVSAVLNWPKALTLPPADVDLMGSCSEELGWTTVWVRPASKKHPIWLSLIEPYCDTHRPWTWAIIYLVGCKVSLSTLS